MDKIKKIIVFTFLMFFCITVNAEEVTIDKVITAFNEGSIAENYKAVGGSMKATYDSDSIDIVVNVNGDELNISFDFDGKVISATIDSSTEEGFAKAYLFSGLADEVGKLYGYESGALSQTLNADVVKDYTLAEEGYEVENISDTVSIIKIDITKKIPLADLSGEYVEVSDLQSSKEYISGDGSFSGNKFNIYYNKQGYDGYFTLVIGEKGTLTNSSYKSVLSFIEVMFEDDNITKYFTDNVPDLSMDKSFNGFEVKIDTTKFTEEDIEELPDDYENTGYEFVLIYIDKEEVIKTAGSKDNNQQQPTTPPVEDEQDDIQDNIEDNKNSENKEKEEEKSTNIPFIAIVAIVIVGGVVIIVVSNKNKSNGTATNVIPQNLNQSVNPPQPVNTTPVINQNPPQNNVQTPQVPVVNKVIPKQTTSVNTVPSSMPDASTIPSTPIQPANGVSADTMNNNLQPGNVNNPNGQNN